MARRSSFDRIVKRLTDLVVALIGLVILSPVLLVLAGLIWARLGSPILFRQRRAGLLGKPFSLNKFRTMKDFRDENGMPLSDEARITSLGTVLRRLSLDELPELLNVISGSMSLVGPRPLPVEYVERYSREQARRLEMKPGLTGWAQINGRNHLSWDEKFALDLWYVDNWSLLLDLKILLTTPLMVFRREGISQEGYATMPEFLGSGRSEAPKSPPSPNEEGSGG